MLQTVYKYAVYQVSEPWAWGPSSLQAAIEVQIRDLLQLDTSPSTVQEDAPDCAVSCTCSAQCRVHCCTFVTCSCLTLNLCHMTTPYLDHHYHHVDSSRCFAWVKQLTVEWFSVHSHDMIFC